MSDLRNLPAMEYMRSSRHSREEIGGYRRPAIGPAPAFKKYAKARRYSLPATWHVQGQSLEKILQSRRSVRKFKDSSMSLETLSFLLWASQGVTAAAGSFLFRTAPSAGALYPVETYIAARVVEGLPPGLYHFDPQLFELELVRSGSVSEDLAMAALGQQFVHHAPASFIWSAIFRRNFVKYGNRGLRYVLLDAGHICQNLLLAAEASGCGGCAVAAFFDEEVNEILQIDGEEESAIYMAAIGIKPDV